MSMFNKKGEEFAHLVTIPQDPKTKPTYSHSFPALVGTKVVERWSTKVRPIHDMTRVLQANYLKRDIDYMVDYNGINKQYEYWFKDDVDAAFFKLASAGVCQRLKLPGTKFRIECPCCGNIYKQEEINWVL